MTQDRAQKIIKKNYGPTAYAIGHTEEPDTTTIFWIYPGENEENCKIHEVKEGEQ